MVSANGHGQNGGLGEATTSVDPTFDRAHEGRGATPKGLPIVPSPDDTAELRGLEWGSASQVAPASTPIAPQPGELSPQSVGSSAWDDDLARLSHASDPERWDRAPQDVVVEQGGSWGPGGPSEPSIFGRLLREWGPVLLMAVVIALVTRLALVQAYHIPSLSMAPTLDEGDRVIVNRLSYRFGEIDRGQVIVFNKPPNQPSDANDLIKRAIAMPGETIQFRDGEVYVDGQLAEEPYLFQQDSTRARSFSIPGCAQAEAAPDTCLVPEGYVFVMGDNRGGSQDSRVFGPIAIDTIVGRAFVRVWPIDHLGWL